MCQSPEAKFFGRLSRIWAILLKLLFFIKPINGYQWHFSLQDLQAFWILFEGDCPKLLLDNTKTQVPMKQSLSFWPYSNFGCVPRCCMLYAFSDALVQLAGFGKISGCHPRHWKTWFRDVLTSFKNIGSTMMSASFSACQHMMFFLSTLWSGFCSEMFNQSPIQPINLTKKCQSRKADSHLIYPWSLCPWLQIHIHSIPQECRVCTKVSIASSGPPRRLTVIFRGVGWLWYWKHQDLILPRACCCPLWRQLSKLVFL